MAKKILLADDSLTIQKVVELTFSDSEYDLLCVPNGQRALEKVADELPDLILADVVMPEKNGYEVCEAIKANPRTSHIPVVLLSGTFEPFDRERAERLGCDAIVSKPFDSQQLLRQVEALLTRDPREVTSNATMAIPTMTNPMPMPVPAPPTPAGSPQVTESGFAAEDFTVSIKTPPGVAGGPDLFEEEYGQADVESAIQAFEKAHPEFSYGNETISTAAMMPEAAPEPEEVTADDPADSRRGLAGWLNEEPERPPVTAPSQPPPAPFWVPREPEPELLPIPFASDDSASRHAVEPPSVRADEAPTQQIPLAAEFAAFARPSSDGERITDKTSPSELGESTADQKAPAAEPYPALLAAAASQAPAVPDTPVSREIEVLAQTTSIGQLKEMLSSVSRSEGGLTDDDIDRLASRVVERLSEKIVREIAWEVIPDVAELVIKQRIKELESNLD